LIKNDPWIFNDPLKKVLSQTIFPAAVGSWHSLRSWSNTWRAAR
jgi:hypothetical protein